MTDAQSPTHEPFDQDEPIDPTLVAAATAFLDDEAARAGEPSPLYRRLTTEAPVLPLGDGRWIISGYHDIRTMLRSPSVQTRVIGTPWAGDAAAGHDDALGALARTFVNEVDGDAHARISHTLGVGWIIDPPPVVRTWAAEVVDDALDAADDGRLDLAATVFRPLPVRVMSQAAGLDEADLDQLRQWASAIGGLPLPASMQPPGWRQQALEAAEGLVPFVEDLIERRRADPGDDLLSLVVERAGDAITHDQLVSIITGLCVGGQDSVTATTTSVLVQIVGVDGLADELRANPDQLDLAVWEAQRLDGAHRFTLRYASEDFTLGGQQIPAGDLLLAFLAAGNRDPKAFPDPDTFVLDRHAHVRDHAQGYNLAHSFGEHHCGGTTLAHTMMDAAFARLLERTSSIELEVAPADLPRAGNLFFSMITELPVRITPA
ncbi:MAG: cytochrome P450 [Acidimicrobiales bacterium]